MRVLYLVNGMAPGGVEIQLRDRAASLVRRGHSVAVVSMLPFVAFESWLRDAGVETATLGLRDRSSVPAAVLRYTAVLRRFRPDVVHAHLFVACLLARLTRLLPPRVRGGWRVLVCSSHSREEIVPGRYLAYRLTNRLGDVWTSASREGIAMHERHGAVPVGAARWAPNGVDLTKYRPDAVTRIGVRADFGVGDTFLWLALGSFRDETKDFGTLLAAFALVPGQNLLFIAGEGRLLEEKRAFAASLGVGDRVRFLGLRSDVEQLLQAADGYVLSSQTEAMPNVLLQASASGLPVVTTDVGEASAIVLHGRTGYVVPPRDSARLADAMRAVEALDPAARAAMGQAGRAHIVEHFDFERVVDRWVALYTELLNAAA